MNVTDEQEFMLPRGEWKRLHDQKQQSKIFTESDLKTKIKVGPDAIQIDFDSPEGIVEWKFRFL